MPRSHVAIAAVTFAGLAAVIVSTGLDKTQPIALDAASAKAIQWDKPKTDAAWAEDVKKENFDIKSTGKLQEMINSHTVKLERELKDNKPIICPECLAYDFRKQFESQGISGKELDDEVLLAVNTAVRNYNFEIEKLQQSIERMNKEVELRQKGFVVTDDKPLPEEPLFGGTRIVRHIQD